LETRLANLLHLGCGERVVAFEPDRFAVAVWSRRFELGPVLAEGRKRRVLGVERRAAAVHANPAARLDRVPRLAPWARASLRAHQLGRAARPQEPDPIGRHVGLAPDPDEAGLRVDAWRAVVDDLFSCGTVHADGRWRDGMRRGRGARCQDLNARGL